MHQHGDDARPVSVVEVVLLGADDALDDGVDRLEVARVGAQGEVHPVASARGVIPRVAEVVLHVAVARRLLGEERPLELGEDRLVGLAEHVGEHVQATAVGHPEDHLLDTQRAPVFDQRVEQGDQRVAALE